MESSLKFDLESVATAYKGRLLAVVFLCPTVNALMLAASAYLRQSHDRQIASASGPMLLIPRLLPTILGALAAAKFAGGPLSSLAARVLRAGESSADKSTRAASFRDFAQAENQQPQQWNVISSG